jgi:hypothetical protein
MRDSVASTKDKETRIRAIAEATPMAIKKLRCRLRKKFRRGNFRTLGSRETKGSRTLSRVW